MSTNKMLSFLRDISRTAQGSSARVRDAVASYKTPVSFVRAGDPAQEPVSAGRHCATALQHMLPCVYERG